MEKLPKLRPRNEEVAPRARIIAAAEELFARKGLYGAPLREIARAAAINVNLISYYFPEKEDLFNAVVDVRVTRLNEMREKLLDALEEKHTPEPIPIVAIVHSFVHPYFALRALDVEGWSNWAQAINRESGTEVWNRMVIRAVGPVLRRYVYALHRAVPNAERADILFLLEWMSMVMVAGKVDETTIMPEAASTEWMDGKTEARIIRSLTAATLAFGET